MVREILGVALVTFVAGCLAAEADTLLVANKSDATLSLVDLESGDVVATLPTGEGPHEVAVSPDGERAAVANYGSRSKAGATLTVVDIPRARVVKTVHLGKYRRPHGLYFLSRDRVVLTAEDNQAVLTIDLERAEVVQAITTDQQISHMLALDPKRPRVYVANIGSGSMTALDLSTGEKLATVATGDGAEGICVTADGGQIWVANRGADTVTLIDPETFEVVATLPSPEFPIRAEATPDGASVLVTNARSGDLTVIDTRARKIARKVQLKLAAKDTEGRVFGDRFGGSSIPIGIEIAPDGKRAYIAHAGADLIQILDLSSWKPVGVLSAGREPDGLAYSAVEIRPAPAAKSGG